jgi:hypothetical protein
MFKSGKQMTAETLSSIIKLLVRLNYFSEEGPISEDIQKLAQFKLLGLV